MVGDLNERFTTEREKLGRDRAVRLYWARTLRSLRPLLRRAIGKALQWGAVIGIDTPCTAGNEQPCRERIARDSLPGSDAAGGCRPALLSMMCTIFHSPCFLRRNGVPKIQHNKIFVRFRVRGHSSVHAPATIAAGAARGKARTMSRERFGVSHVPNLSWSVEAHPCRRSFDAQHLPMRRLPADHDGRERDREGLVF
jgi:hypothetical protein